MATFSNLCCPRCHTALKSNKALPIGAAFVCRGCEAKVLIDVRDGREPVVRLVRAKAPRPQTKSAQSDVRVVAVALLLLMFCTGATTVAYFCLLRDRVQAPAAVADEALPPPSASEFDSVPGFAAVTPTAPPAAPQTAATASTPQPPRQREPVAPTAKPAPAEPAPEVGAAGLPAAQTAKLPHANTARVDLTKEQRQQIDEAIARGVKYIRAEQLQGQRRGHDVGRVALRGLTLLECGVPANDPYIQQAALFIRLKSRTELQVYDAALALLFLDRLGFVGDTQMIQVLALRIIGGQTQAGGWSYTCMPLDIPEMQQLITFLQLTRPKLRTDTPLANNTPPPFLVPLPEKLDMRTPLAGEGTPTSLPLDKGGGLLSQPLFREDIELATPLLGTARGIAPGVEPGTGKQMAAPPVAVAKPRKASKTGDTGKSAASAPGVAKAGPRPRPEMPAGPIFVAPQLLGVKLRELPVVLNQDKQRGQINLPDVGRDDNSNSQFALLALWAARRHGVASERVLFLAEQRYRQWQNNDGGWGYMRGQGSSAAMTSVGLLGLAMGHGADFEVPAGNTAPSYTDPAIQRGLDRFASYIGVPKAKSPPDMQNLYFLWSVERVAMLYRLPTIGGKDWYAWGSQCLLAHQNEDGSFASARYPGNHDTGVDTCFALLFLRRSNLTEDLANSINQRIATQK